MSRKRLASLLLTSISCLSIFTGLALVVEPTFAEQKQEQAPEHQQEQEPQHQQEREQVNIPIEDQPNTNNTAIIDPNGFSMTLSPSTQTLDLAPNDTYEGSVNVTNSGKTPITFTAQTTPFHIADDSYTPDYAAVNRYTELANWIKLDQTEYHIQPGETAEVKFRVEVPAVAVGGGQYAAIMIYSEDSIDPSATIGTASQLAALLYGHVEGDEMVVEGNITKHHFPWLATSGPLEISATAQNAGNVDFAMRQTVTIKNFFTNEEYFGPNITDADGNLASIHETVVMPGTSRTDIIIWENTPRIGLYRVEQTVSILGETITETGFIIFCPLWIIILFLVLVALLILWIVLAIIRRRRNHSRVF